MGLAAFEGREAGHRFDAEPGHTDFAQGEGGTWARCLGARVLPEVSEQAAGLHRGVVERRELGFGVGFVRQGEEVAPADILRTRGTACCAPTTPSRVKSKRPDPNFLDRAFSIAPQ